VKRAVGPERDSQAVAANDDAVHDPRPRDLPAARAGRGSNQRLTRR
jgi:hypothetical protein